ncbi:MAG: beta-lactamase family protein [Acidimicrobiia bacterium]|nr:beta-lactamase family protein [Acidimicrobiia bacterium]
MRRVIAGVLSVLLLATACGSAESSPVAASGDLPTDPTAVPAEPTAEAVEETVAAADETVEPEPEADLTALVTAEVDEFMAANSIPGMSVAVLLPDGESITLARGVADIASGEPVTVDDYFRIGSITKPVTTAVVLQLVDEGLVDLDESVSTYLPGWAPGYEFEDEVTVRQLLNHTNGFIEYAFDPGFYVEAGSRADVPYEPEEIIAFAADRGPQYDLGTEYQYNTTGFLAAGLLIEAVTGNAAADEIRTRLFEPFGLEEIYLTPTELPPEPTVHGYARAELASAIVALDVVPAGVGVLDVDGEQFADLLAGPQEVLQSSGWTGGGLEAQLADVAGLMRGIFAGGTLSDDALAEMTAPTLDTNYGLGLAVDTVAGELVYQHGGGVPGFRSHAAYLPERDIALAFSANLIPLELDVGDLMERLTKVLTS